MGVLMVLLFISDLMVLFVLFHCCSGILGVLFIVEDLVCLEILWSLYSWLVLEFYTAFFGCSLFVV